MDSFDDFFYTADPCGATDTTAFAPSPRPPVPRRWPRSPNSCRPRSPSISIFWIQTSIREYSRVRRVSPGVILDFNQGIRRLGVEILNMFSSVLEHKFIKNANLQDNPPLLGGGLEPHFRVLFSAIFHGVSLGNFHQGRNRWKLAEAKVWQIVVDLRTKFLCVLMIVCLSRGCEESQYNAVLSQGIICLRIRGQSPWGRPNTGGAPSPINSPGVGCWP